MSLPGWYPDPSGRPGRFRYWTGTSWSAGTTGDPSSPPPKDSSGPAGPAIGPGGSATGPGARQSRQPRRTGLLIALLALLLAIVVVAGVFVAQGLGGDGTTAGPDPGSTVSGWDDSSPFPTATPTVNATPSPSPAPSRKTPSPTPTTGAPAPLTACPSGDPLAREAHPSDGRYHGGGLSFAQHRGWEDAAGYLDGLSWAYDVAGEEQRTEPFWEAIFGVGALHRADGFVTPRQSADGVMQCIASSDYYQEFSGRTDVRSRAVTVDGHSGWELRSEIRVDNSDLSVPGDLVEVIVLDTGQNGTSGMFVGAVPIGDQERIATLDRTVADLRVD